MRYILFTLITGCFFGCGTNIDQSLQAKIETTSARTADLFDEYEELNENLSEVLADYERAHKKLIRAKNTQREINELIANRLSKMNKIQAAEPKEGEPVVVVDSKQAEAHKEKLAEYEEQLKENQLELDEFYNLSKSLNEQALSLRPARNAAWDAYVKSRDELKALEKQAESTTAE